MSPAVQCRDVQSKQNSFKILSFYVDISGCAPCVRAVIVVIGHLQEQVNLVSRYNKQEIRAGTAKLSPTKFEDVAEPGVAIWGTK